MNHHYYIIKVGTYFLAGKTKLNSEIQNAKSFETYKDAVTALEAYQAIDQDADSSIAKELLVQALAEAYVFIDRCHR